MKNARWFNQFLISLHTPIAFVLNIAIAFSGAWFYASLESWHTVTVSKVALPTLLVVVLVFVDFLLKYHHDKATARHAREEYINQLLEAAGYSMLRAANPPSDHIRVNIMLPDSDNKNLTIKYCWGFEPGDKDREIRVPVWTGCAGQAYMNKSVILGDVTELTKPGGIAHWGLPPEEIKKIRPSLQSIFSVPVPFGNSHEQLAILNFDSDNSIGEMNFQDTNMQKIAYSFVKTVQVPLGDML